MIKKRITYRNNIDIDRNIYEPQILDILAMTTILNHNHRLTITQQTVTTMHYS